MLDQLTSSMLLGLANLAGYLDQHQLPALLRQAHTDLTIGSANKVDMITMAVVCSVWTCT